MQHSPFVAVVAGRVRTHSWRRSGGPARFLTAMVALAAVCLAGCSSTAPAGGVASPYFRPAGTDLFYKYGNFCGPGVPVAEGDASAENIAQVAATRPIDGIDGVCKMHDLCYLRYGVQAWCDLALRRMFTFGRFVEDTGACDRLASEIRGAVELRSVVQSDLSVRVFAPVLVPMAGVSVANHFTANALYAATGVGWPSEGACRFAGGRGLPDISYMLARARLKGEFGTADGRPELAAEYQGSFDFYKFLSGGW